MRSWLRKLLNGSTKRKSATAVRESSPRVPVWKHDEKRFSFAALWNDFDRRCNHDYDYARPVLGWDNPRLLNWMGSIEYSGYTRENSLRYLIDNYLPGDENRILLRLSDWVEQVRSLAETWTYRHFDDLAWDAIKENDRLLVYLSRKERLLDSHVMTHITKVLLEKTNDAGQKAFYELNLLLRRHLYHASMISKGTLRPWILDDPDPFNRLLLLSPEYGDSLSDAEISKFKIDPSVFVRRRYLYLLIGQEKQPPREDLIRFSLDRNQGLRACARYYLDKIYSIDSYEIYKQQGGIVAYYIADFAKPGDLNFFINGINHPDRKVQLLCLKALTRIDSENLREVDIERLILENRRTRQIILPYLPKLYSLDELLGMRDILEKSSPNGIYSYFSVIEKKSFWVFVNIVLGELVVHPEDQRSLYVQKTVMAKADIYETLPDQQAREIRAKMHELKRIDERRFTRLIDWIAFSTRSVADMDTIS